MILNNVLVVVGVDFLEDEEEEEEKQKWRRRIPRPLPPSPVLMILSPLVGTNESIIFIILTIIIRKVEKMKKQCV